MEETNSEVKGKKVTMSGADEEIKRLELERLQLEVLEKKANLQDMKERLDERELKRETIRQRSVTNGATLKQLGAIDAAIQKRCNHHKGGNGAQGVIGGQGDNSDYAVLKHVFSNGDTWIRCLRCGKTWKPPLRNRYETEVLFEQAREEYRVALNFQTKNATSGAFAFGFSDGGQKYREAMANTTLR